MSKKQLTFENAVELQRDRFSTGESVSVEELLANCPEAESSSERQLDLIYGEILQREQLGETLDETEFVKRFPGLEEEIGRQFQVHRAIESSNTGLRHDTPYGSDGDAFGTEPTDQGLVSQLSIAGFEVIEIIGRGGSGIAFKARDLNLGRMVAIKLINSVLSLDDESRSRFIREAESAASLQHPSIVSVYQIGKTETGVPFLVMALVEGDSLVSKVRSGPVPAKEAVELLIPIVEAVSYANQKGIVHRDIKPGNILLDEGGNPFVCDFGLAKRIDAEYSMNVTGSIVGTPAYMPPEQARGESVDGRTDVYSLGVLLYELLSGRNPFQASSIWETLQHVLTNDAVLLRQLNPSLDQDLETICQRCMEKSPSARYGSAQELFDELKRYQSGEPIQARPIGPLSRLVRWSRREPKLAALAGVVALMGGVLTAVVTVAAIRVRDANSETMTFKSNAAEARIEALVNALPDAVPLTIESLDRSDSTTSKTLSEIVENPLTKLGPRLNAVLGLASLGDHRPKVVVDCMRNVPMRAGTCRNIVSAFADSPDELLAMLNDPEGKGVDQMLDFRFANTALFLGDNTLAKRLTKLDADPRKRMLFIHQFGDWHGSPAYFSQILNNETDLDLLSAVCVAIGKVDPNSISEDAVAEIVKSFKSLYQNHENAAIHSTAEFALKKWKVALPEIETGRKGWRLTESGNVMIQMEPTTLTLGVDEETRNLPHTVTLSKPFEIASKEVTVAEFQMFTDSLDVGDILSSWEHSNRISPHVDCPAQQITWVEAVRYCNWLSEKEGSEPCYRSFKSAKNESGSNECWACDFSANGYRLPTEAEWEYAGRAKSEVASTFGGDPRIALEHVRFSHATKDATLPVGSLIPNGFGLFDVEGNVWEWCWDKYEPLGHDELKDPLGPDGTEATDFSGGRVNRGGGVANRSGRPYVCGRGSYNGLRKAYNVGIRVARTVKR